MHLPPLTPPHTHSPPHHHPQNLSKLPAAPSADFKAPPDAMGVTEAEAMDEDVDARGGGQAVRERRIERDDERDGGLPGGRYEYNPRDDPDWDGPEKPAALAEGGAGAGAGEVKGEEGARGEGGEGGEDEEMGE